MNKIFLIGTGNRSLELFVKPLKSKKEYKDCIVGVYDVNIKRAKYIAQAIGTHVVVYEDYEEVLKLKNIDAYVILSTDDTHAKLIYDIVNYTTSYVFCEKPCCINEEQINMLSSLTKEKQDRIFIMFNSRFMPINLEIKKIISSGAIGTPYSLSYIWNIDKKHGVEYFRRWHSDYKRSAGLLVHKSCHHFDLLNWWLDDTVSSIIAKASKLFYQTDDNVEEKCRSCNKQCQYQMDIQNMQSYNELYFQTETEDGYMRDKCIYKDVSIEDTMSVLLEYFKGTLVTYAINFYSQNPQWYLNVVGSEGDLRIIYDYQKDTNEITYISKGKENSLKVASNNQKHSGGDECIRKIIFSTNLNTLSKMKNGIGSLIEGINACQIGITANSFLKKDRNIGGE